MKKLNKKGFTLVELLAVIVILAVVILVAVNNVIPQMNKAKAGAFKTEALSFLDGAEQYYTSQQMTNGEFNETKDGTKLEGVTIKYLVDKKYVKSADIDKYEGCIKYDEANGKFQIQLWSNSYKTVNGSDNNYVEATKLSDFNGEVTNSSVIQSTGSTQRKAYECGKSTP